MKGSKMLLAFIKHNAVVIQDEQFWGQLLHIGMNFIGGIIRAKSQQVGLKANAFDEIQKFAKFVDQLRHAKLEIGSTRQEVRLT